MAALACLFWNHRAVPAVTAGESFEDVRKRINDIIHDSDVAGPTLKMRNPEKARVVWERVS